MNPAAARMKRPSPAQVLPLAPALDPFRLTLEGAGGGRENPKPVRTFRTFRIFRKAAVVRAPGKVRASAKPRRSLRAFRMFRNAPAAPEFGAGALARGWAQ